MTTLLSARDLVRASGGAVAGLAVLHTTLVAWVAWYLVEAAWSGAPPSASRTPLPPMTFTGAWIAAVVALLAMGPAVGVRAARGAWDGTDPTATLPIGSGTRLLSAWLGSAAVLGVVALAPLPVYLALLEMGAFAPAAVPAPFVTHLAVIGLGPLPGIVVVLAGRGRAAS